MQCDRLGWLLSACVGLQIDVIPALTGDACLGNAFALQQSRVIAATPSSSSLNTGQGRVQAVPVYLHERGFVMMSEDHYLVAGLSANPLVIHTDSHEVHFAVGSRCLRVCKKLSIHK